jgi:hypothetical protein
MKTPKKAAVSKPTTAQPTTARPGAQRSTSAFEQASVGRRLHDELEADDDGFIAGAGFDYYGGFPGAGLS